MVVSETFPLSYRPSQPTYVSLVRGISLIQIRVDIEDVEVKYLEGLMAARSAIWQLRFFRPARLGKPSARKYATTTSNSPAQTWPHQSQFGNIHDDQVARLAAQPLHSLALADLVR